MKTLPNTMGGNGTRTAATANERSAYDSSGGGGYGDLFMAQCSPTVQISSIKSIKSNYL
jgi:hypothetical protein